jgi:hypothetical protein
MWSGKVVVQNDNSRLIMSSVEAQQGKPTASLMCVANKKMNGPADQVVRGDKACHLNMSAYVSGVTTKN